MAVTKISDVVVPEVYNDYFMEASVYKSVFYKAGIVALDPKLSENLKGGAESFSTPFWKSNDVIGADATPVDEDADLTPGSIGSAKMEVRRQFREKSWGQNDVASVLAGSDPIEGIKSLMEEFWNVNYQRVLFNSVQGVIADNVANDSGDMLNDITALTGDDGKIHSDAVIDTIAKFGDMTGGITAVAMHSVCYTNLLKSNLIDTTPDNVQNIGWGVYLGKTVIVDDSLIDASSKYWTVLFKPGAFGFAEDLTGPYEPTETERNPSKSGGQELLYTRRVFAMHPFGFKYVEPGSPTADFPTNAELKLAAQWDRVVSSVKNVGFSVLKSNG